MKYHKAPRSTSLLLLSAVGVAIFGAVAFGLLSIGGGRAMWMALLPLGLLCGCALFTVRGYSLASNALLVHRLFWATQLPLAGLRSAEYEPGVMGSCLRTFGNGGLFSFSGFFLSKAPGNYRAFVTDPQRTVVLRFPRRTVVVSPAAPEEFVRDLGVRAPA